MTLSKRLVAASANRMVSFYDLQSTNYAVPTSRIEGLVGIPLCVEYYKWPKNNDSKLETLLIGDDLGICHMYNFLKADWHVCEYKVGSQDPNLCHKEEIIKEYDEDIRLRFEENAEKKKNGRKKLNGGGLAVAEDTGDKPDKVAKKSSKYLGFRRRELGISSMEKLIHKGWITKIKFYPDLNYIISSSLDGFIHIHDIDKLEYREGKTFNLHQKGVNSFIYSSKHRFVASCGEERHILMWDPFTIGVLSYLYGHNTSVQDLALNEERHHLISLGTDKVVKIWDIRTYACIQTIFDKVCYRPEDRLTSMIFDKVTNNILLGSRKLNLWFFKTQEEIKTSHEYPVAFALNNGEFESVVSADDGGFIAVWDIEDGKLMSKFGNAHGARNKITAGCFDSTQRRLVTAGSDGTCKVWNFSNGQCLSDLTSGEEAKPNPKKVDAEITALVCVHDPAENPGNLPEAEIVERMSYLVSVGWDKKIHVWADERSGAEEVPTHKILPQGGQEGHADDIMSAVYCRSNTMIYTGGHDGSIIAWNFETGYSKYKLHDNDKTCTSKDYITDSKSVDAMLILKEKDKLMTMTADQHLRFWSLNELTGGKQPSFKIHCKHPPDDGLTAVAVTSENDILLTGDTSGQLKMWDISEVDLNDQTTENKFIEKYFIIAHRGNINTIQIAEEIKSERFIITAANDNNINLHRLRDGVFIGQFG